MTKGASGLQSATAKLGLGSGCVCCDTRRCSPSPSSLLLPPPLPTHPHNLGFQECQARRARELRLSSPPWMSPPGSPGLLTSPSRNSPLGKPGTSMLSLCFYFSVAHVVRFLHASVSNLLHSIHSCDSSFRVPVGFHTFQHRLCCDDRQNGNGCFWLMTEFMCCETDHGGGPCFVHQDCWWNLVGSRVLLGNGEHHGVRSSRICTWFQLFSFFLLDSTLKMFVCSCTKNKKLKTKCGSHNTLKTAKKRLKLTFELVQKKPNWPKSTTYTSFSPSSFPLHVVQVPQLHVVETTLEILTWMGKY